MTKKNDAVAIPEAAPVPEPIPVSGTVTRLPERIVVHDDSDMSMMLDTGRFEQAQRVARLFAASALVPEQYRGKPENVFIAMLMANRMKLDPMMVMQNTYVIKGKFAIEAKLAIALINTSGLFTAPLQFRFEGEGDARICFAYTTHKGSGAKLEAKASIAMAKADGWYAKEGSKWKTLPDLMLMYRSAMFFGRLYCPERILGMQAVEEVEDAEASAEAAHPGKTVMGRFGIKEEIGIIDEIKPIPVKGTEDGATD